MWSKEDSFSINKKKQPLCSWCSFLGSHSLWEGNLAFYIDYLDQMDTFYFKKKKELNKHKVQNQHTLVEIQIETMFW